ncbi:MAG: hypothetical protein ACLFSF_05165, partial [Desulfonatronovibrio sp.]
QEMCRRLAKRQDNLFGNLFRKDKGTVMALSLRSITDTHWQNKPACGLQGIRHLYLSPASNASIEASLPISRHT